MQQTGQMKVFFSSFTTRKLGTDQCLEHLSCRLLILQTYMLIWKRSLPKCNLRMAQGTKCLHAICNYMRKVKLKYQHVRPAPALHTNTVYLVYLYFLYRFTWINDLQFYHFIGSHICSIYLLLYI